MNAKKFAIAFVLAATAAGATFAGDRDYPKTDTTVVSDKTRAEVVADLREAQAEGRIFIGDNDNSTPLAIAASKSRNDVRAELVAAIRNNALPVITN